MMPPDLQPWQRKALRFCWQQSKWAIKYADMGMPEAARDATIQAVRFYHHAFPGASEASMFAFQPPNSDGVSSMIGVSHG